MESRPEFKVSTRKHKKYSVVTPEGKTIHFGDTWYQHYWDEALGEFKHLDHLDEKWRDAYRKWSEK